MPSPDQVISQRIFEFNLKLDYGFESGDIVVYVRGMAAIYPLWQRSRIQVFESGEIQYREQNQWVTVDPNQIKFLRRRR